MTLAAQFAGDVQVSGTLTPARINLPPGSVTAGAVSGGPGQYLPATNQGQQYQPEYKQASGATAAADQQVVHVTRGASAVLIDFVVGAVVANIGAAIVTFDLWKNGSSVLSAPIVLTSATAAYALAGATITTASSVAGDVFEVKVTVAASSGTLAKGAFARLCIREDPN